MPSTLLAQRPDIRQAEADLVAANADINAARAALFPNIRLTAAGGFESVSLASLLRSGSLAYTLAAGLTAPLFDGGRLRGLLALSKARQDELIQVYQQVILIALREVEDSLTAVQRLAEQAAYQREVVAHAITALRMAELRYRNGAVDFATVLDAQRVLLAAQAEQETITVSRYAAATGLYRALGGGWEPSAQISMDSPSTYDGVLLARVQSAVGHVGHAEAADRRRVVRPVAEDGTGECQGNERGDQARAVTVAP